MVPKIHDQLRICNYLSTGYGCRMREPPAPGECHPAYQDYPWLRDWLNGAPGYSDSYRMKIAMVPRLSLDPIGGSASELDLPMHILTKEKAAGLAPYVGDPFMYVWYVATDELGRSVAGDAHIRYYSLASTVGAV